MLEFELNYFRKIRLWLDKNQNLVLSDNSNEVRKYPTCLNQSFFNTTIIIELLIPRGGRNVYGLLGADYTPLEKNDLEVTVFSGNTLKPRILNDSLIEKIEPAYFCLPNEYRASIFEKIEAINRQSMLNFNGKLDFRYGAVSEISSNEWIFGKLTSMIIALIHVAEEKITAESLNKMIDN